MSVVHDVDSKISALLKDPPPLHLDGDGKLVNYQIDPQLVPHLRELVRPGFRTMETGSGVSTIIFLALGARHSSVTPDGGEAERIRAYCQSHGIPADGFAPIVGGSERVLPALSTDEKLDLALVDGNHAFPVPCLDWYYLTRLLKKGGVMIVDDIQLWSGRILADFLDKEDVWQRLTRTLRFAIYRMLDEPDKVLSRWWGQQPYVVANSESTTGVVAGLRKLFRG